MRKYVCICLMIWVALVTRAQTLTVSVPSKVAPGETFRLQYTVNTKDVDGKLQLGQLPEELEVVYGPSMSQQESYNVINGHASGSSSVTYTYMIMCEKNGTYTIPPAHIKVGGKTLASGTAKVVVAGQASSGSSGGGGAKMHQDKFDDPGISKAGTPISANDLFIRVSASKTRVHEQEPILLSYKVYTRVKLTQLNGKMPDLKGFHTQEVELPQQKSFHDETVNGHRYQCVTWSQYVMYPQMTGKLEIPSITFKGIVMQENRNIDPLEAFFNGGAAYIEVEREIEAPGVTIQVDSLPARPANFSGGVGRFNISAQIENQEVKTGDPVKLRVVVGGTGNLKLLKQPIVQFPKDFDTYDPEVTDKTKLTSNGVEGNMVYDFIAVPRNQGEYTIPAVELVYYDTSSNSYKTARSQPFKLTVTQGEGSATVSDFTDMRDKDIRPIKKGRADLHKAGQFFYESTPYWICIAVPLLLFVVLLVLFRHRAIENADIIKMKAKNANKLATKKLRTANRMMLRGENNLFYDEVLKALWGYVGDKLNMPQTELTRDNVSDKLAAAGVEQETVDKFVGALDECEYERFAPGDAKGNMNKTFESAMTAIMEIEKAMKKRKQGRVSMVLVIFALMMPVASQAVTKENADAEYTKGNYQQAIKDYEELLQKGVSAEIYYNLGNAYFRTDNITKAILNYERARMLAPGDEDILFNLQFAQSKTIDRITPNDEMFFVNWYHSLVSFTTVDRWAFTAVLSIIAVLVLLLIYLFAEGITLRKVGFYGALTFLVLFILANVFAYQQKRMLENRKGAVVTASSVNVLKSPADKADTAFVLHEGTRVDITDKSIKGWCGVRIADGREGWMQTDKMEEI